MTDSDSTPEPDDFYGGLSIREVLSALPNLDREQLLVVRSHEAAGGRRPVILDQVADLLAMSDPQRTLPDAETSAAPGNPAKPLSQDVVEQMGRLLAKDDARRSATAAVAINRPG